MSYARRHSTNVCPGNRVRYTGRSKAMSPMGTISPRFCSLRFLFIEFPAQPIRHWPPSSASTASEEPQRQFSAAV